MFKVPRPGSASTVDSQIDGVAQQWHRIEGVAPTAIQAEQQHVQSMKKQWDRVAVNIKVKGIFWIKSAPLFEATFTTCKHLFFNQANN